MLINGFAKLTLLDYPEHVACTIFTGGCNLKCPFCHNASLALRPGLLPRIPEEEVLSFLSRRKGILDGVCVSGGEPLLMPDLADFLGRIKEIGYAVKLDTNGTFPDRLAAMIDRGLVDMVAMDIKNSPEKYPLTTGIPDFDISPIKESVSVLMGGSVPYEFRTTAVKEFHESEDFHRIGEWICGARAHYIQSFVDSGDIIGSDLHAHSAQTLQGFVSIMQKYVNNSHLRGV